MSEAPFTPEEEAELYSELGIPTQTDTHPDMGSTVVVQVPNVNDVEFDTSLIEHLDLTDGQQRAEASRILFAKYGGSAMGLPKGSHRTNWNSLIHQRISMFLGRQKAAKVAEQGDSLRRTVESTSAEKVKDTAAVSTQAALRVLKDQVLDEDGEIDLAKFAELLKEA